eukprot:CAMPEP_0183598986 /NCGR_PEP_ID=MMETSP0371-20130417/179204_1 /TAXON_ID=268820 /ORGANISM="Peridinium aciculiferum, Strain PAER-2" /LENGTH=723 /DNA_ID=CAMNT_0025811049 /DNA_START=65 /DNA_END=2233 /DNA_ORIENTATION=-
MAAAIFALSLLALGDLVSARSEVTPVQKVIQLMEGMLAKGKEEKHGEQVQFAAFKQFCDDTSVEKKRAIDEASEKIDMLKADIEKYIATAARLTKEIAEHDEDISVWTGDQKAATRVREIEKADYDALHQDYSESVDALQRAVAVLKTQGHDRKQASLVQVSALKELSLIPESAKKTLDAFLQQDPEGLEVSAPEAYGYEFQSHGIIEMLEKLLDEFIAERTKLEKEEMNGKHAYDMLMQDLTAQIAQATQDREEKSESKAKNLQAKADAEGDLKDTTDTRDADQQYLNDLTATCEQKASDFESRQQLRAKKTLDAFLQQDPEGLEVSAPEAYGYEFQSHGIIEMLEKLLDEFIAERTKLEKEEMNAKHAYDMLMQDLTAQIAQATQDREEKSESKAKNLQAKADAEGDLKDTTDTRDADQQYLNDLTATCEQKASDFESRQQLRAEELEAINKAIEIISSGAVSGNAEKHLPSLAQQGPALAMLRSDTQNKLMQGRVAQFLSTKARELNSRVLSALAVRVEADPFVKVKKMIKDLIVRLMEEANEEADHKGWCDTELSTNEQTRKEKTEAVETLHAEIDQLEASIAKLTEDIAELTKAVAELDAAMAEATKLRQDEKAKNEQTITDSQEAQTAVAQALTVLKEFYEKAGDATALLQQQPESPEIFDSPYKGMQSENGGIIGMLEVIESDFARLESDTKAAEATAQKEYDTFMTDSKVDKESK